MQERVRRRAWPERGIVAPGFPRVCGSDSAQMRGGDYLRGAANAIAVADCGAAVVNEQCNHVKIMNKKRRAPKPAPV